MLYITVSTKGGVGKSSFAGQPLVSYVHYKNDGEIVNYVEIDDQNESIRNLVESELIAPQIVKTENVETFAMHLMLENTDAVIDVGGNITAQLFLERVNEMGGMRGNAVYFIPLLDSLQDLQNAIKTYNLIREADSESKVIFVLNRCMNKNNDELTKEQFLFVYGKKELGIQSIFEIIGHEIPIMKINQSPTYNILAYLKRTIAEVAQQSVKKELEEAIRRNKEDPSARADALRYLYLERIITSSQKIVQQEFIPLFKQIDSILGA
jgi:CO dehydrogenase nickel-insertion accessory protein CooC1